MSPLFGPRTSFRVIETAALLSLPFLLLRPFRLVLFFLNDRGGLRPSLRDQRMMGSSFFSFSSAPVLTTPFPCSPAHMRRVMSLQVPPRTTQGCRWLPPLAPPPPPRRGNPAGLLFTPDRAFSIFFSAFWSSPAQGITVKVIETPFSFPPFS